MSNKRIEIDDDNNNYFNLANCFDSLCFYCRAHQNQSNGHCFSRAQYSQTYKVKVSIITPCFNSADYLEETIESVLSQGIENLEYIIIDGGSSDKTVEIIRKYEKYLSYWVSEPDNGQSQAINKGLKIVSGDIVNWLNSDDYLEENALSKIIEYFKDPECKVVCGRSRNFSTNDSKLSRGTDVFENNLDKTIGQARFDQPETWFRREAYLSTGLLSEKLHYLMDREWWIRYLLIHGLDGIVRSDELLVHFRLHEKSKTVSQFRDFQIDHDTIFKSLATVYGFASIGETINAELETLDNYLFPDVGDIKADVKRVLNYYNLKRSHECYYMGNQKKASNFLALIEPDLFEKEDRVLFNKIRFRNKPIISGLRSWLKR